MEDWQNFTIEELGTLHNSRRIPLSSTQRSKRQGEFPYYGASGIVDYIDDFAFEGEHVLISEDGENLRTRKTPVAFIARGKFWVNNHAHILKCNSEDLTRLVTYYFSQLDLNEFITGAVQPKLNKSSLCSIPIYLPKSSRERRAIAGVLSCLDDKIDLLHRQNKTLDALSETFFRKWFVEEEQDLNWPKKRIVDVVDHLQYGFTQSATAENVGPKFLRITDIQGGAVNWDSVPHCVASENEFQKYQLCHGDIVIARTGASTGENYFCYKPDNAVFASYLVRLKCLNLELARYIAMHTRSSDYFDYIEGILSGSAQPNANAQELSSFEILLPADDVLEKFYSAIAPLDEKRHMNCLQIRTLQKIRDTLLPKLMSGEVRVAYDG